MSVERENLPFEQIRIADIKANPCNRGCQHKDYCKLQCKIYRHYVNQDGLYSKRDIERAAAYANLTSREKLLYDNIRGTNI